MQSSNRSRTLRVLQVHNAYLTGHGGEDTVLENERRLLVDQGHDVVVRTVSTSSEDVGGTRQLVRTAKNSVYSHDSRRLVKSWIDEVRPDVVHVHNTFPILSPSIFHELHDLAVPTVLTLHNYRIACANGLFLRNGQACDRCLEGSPLQAVRHRCYKSSIKGSCVQVATRMVHDRLGTFTEKVDAMIVLSDFAKDMFKRFGIPAEKLHVKPNFVFPRVATPVEKEKAFVFVGKIVPEKGLGGLLEAWKFMQAEGWKLWIVGDGVDRADLERTYEGLPGVTWMGWQGSSEVRDLVARASWLVLPSVWYEGFPMALTEGFAEGTPAIVPNLGAMPEIVGHGDRGMVYDGTVEGLRVALERAMEANLQTASRYQEEALRSVAGPYSPGANVRRLEEIYREAIERVETRTFPAKVHVKVGRRPLSALTMSSVDNHALVRASSDARTNEEGTIKASASSVL